MIGKTILHYQILEKLGEGGMGVVYKAEDTKLERTVALKFLSSTATVGDEEKKRFKREAKAAAALNHPNIATIFAIDEAEGQTFIAMEFIEGQSISDLVGAQNPVPLRLDDAVDYATQIAAGLQAAHEKGIVHRDIKNANVMVTDKGVVKIMDFGLASLAGGSKVTQLGTTLGTAAYMPPEQARGEKADHRADIWALGVVLYEMVSGQLPFKGDYEQAVIYSILNEDPAPLTALRTGIPMELEWLVTKMLAKDPAARYQHAAEVPVDLKAIAELKGASKNSLAPTAVKTVKTTSISRPIKRLPWRGAIIIGLLIIAIAAVAVTWFQATNRPPVIVLMDSPIPERVYDPQTRAKHGTNSDDLTDILRDLPLVLHKETTSSFWHREHQVLKQRPDLIIIHRSCFYDATTLRDTSFVDELYTLAVNKLVTFMSYIALGCPNTNFLIYSRGFGDASEQARWVSDVGTRFPLLNGKITTFKVPGGTGNLLPGQSITSTATFRNPETGRMVKQLVRSILNLQ